jgi:hypothetical protein
MTWLRVYALASFSSLNNIYIIDRYSLTLLLRVRILGTPSLKSIPRPCIVRVFRTDACGGSTEYADTIFASLRLGMDKAEKLG